MYISTIELKKAHFRGATAPCVRTIISCVNLPISKKLLPDIDQIANHSHNFERLQTKKISALNVQKKRKNDLRKLAKLRHRLDVLLLLFIW